MSLSLLARRLRLQPAARPPPLTPPPRLPGHHRPRRSARAGGPITPSYVARLTQGREAALGCKGHCYAVQRNRQLSARPAGLLPSTHGRRRTHAPCRPSISPWGGTGRARPLAAARARSPPCSLYTRPPTGGSAAGAPRWGAPWRSPSGPFLRTPNAPRGPAARSAGRRKPPFGPRSARHASPAATTERAPLSQWRPGLPVVALSSHPEKNPLWTPRCLARLPRWSPQ